MDIPRTVGHNNNEYVSGKDITTKSVSVVIG